MPTESKISRDKSSNLYFFKVHKDDFNNSEGKVLKRECNINSIKYSDCIVVYHELCRLSLDSASSVNLSSGEVLFIKKIYNQISLEVYLQTLSDICNCYEEEYIKKILECLVNVNYINLSDDKNTIFMCKSQEYALDRSRNAIYQQKHRELMKDIKAELIENGLNEDDLKKVCQKHNDNKTLLTKLNDLLKVYTTSKDKSFLINTAVKSILTRETENAIIDVEEKYKNFIKNNQ